uniref:Transmembrane protein 154 isoform X2 n=1 Tax=Geotrypetes seraphini TaxID=260995 RepID=A0A6P8S130_GEOSA|nr:transmembrane protein 154 isoform X2 [Geotrypetes seraphini]
MQKSSFALSLILWLAAGFPYEDESSGEGILPTEGLFSTKGEPNYDSSDDDTSLANQDFTVIQLALMIGVPVLVALVLLILIIICLVNHYRRERPKEKDNLAGENNKSPIFQEDTQSVMEIEMEELDKWMSSMNKRAQYKQLSAMEEEKKTHSIISEYDF